MAETVQQTTIQRPSPYIEEAGKAYLEKLGTQAQTALTPAGYAPSVAAQSALTQAQQQQAITEGMPNMMKAPLLDPSKNPALAAEMAPPEEAGPPPEQPPQV